MKPATTVAESARRIKMPKEIIAATHAEEDALFARARGAILHSTPNAFLPTADGAKNENRSSPAQALRLAQAFGFRTRDSHSNLHFIPTSQVTAKVVYAAGTLGIVHALDNIVSSTQARLQSQEQSFFRGHNNDIVALAVHKDRRLVATGQLGLTPTIHIWTLLEQQQKSSEPSYKSLATIVLPYGDKGLSALTFSNKGDMLVAVAQDTNNTIYLIDWAKAKSNESTAAVLASQLTDTTPAANKAGHVVNKSDVLDVAILASTRGGMTPIIDAHTLGDRTNDLFSFVTIGGQSITFYTYTGVTSDLTGSKFTSHNGVFRPLAQVVALHSVIWLPYTTTGKSDAESYLATGTQSGDVLLWDAKVGTVVYVHSGAHPCAVSALAASSPKSTNVSNETCRTTNLVTGGRDGVVKRWTIYYPNESATDKWRVELIETINVPKISPVIVKTDIGDIGGNDSIDKDKNNNLTKNNFTSLSTSAIHALDVFNDLIVIGLRSSSIYVHTCASSASTIATVPRTAILLDAHSASQGHELWGLDVTDSRGDQGSRIVSGGQDGQIMLWSLAPHCSTSGEQRPMGLVYKQRLNEPLRRVAIAPTRDPFDTKSSHIPMPAYHGHIAAGSDLGVIHIFSFNLQRYLGCVQTLASTSTSVKIIALLKYSPHGQYLAVAHRHLNLIEVFSIEQTANIPANKKTTKQYDLVDGYCYRRVAKCQGHSSYVTAMDWSWTSSLEQEAGSLLSQKEGYTDTHVTEGLFLQSNSADYELLFWDIRHGGIQVADIYDLGEESETHFEKQATGLAIRNVIEADAAGIGQSSVVSLGRGWASFTCPIAWASRGIWNSGQDGTDVNALDRDVTQSLLIVGTDSCTCELLRYPCHVGGRGITQRKVYNAHSAHVTGVKFACGVNNGAKVISIGGMDCCLMVWDVVGSDGAQYPGTLKCLPQQERAASKAVVLATNQIPPNPPLQTPNPSLHTATPSVQIPQPSQTSSHEKAVNDNTTTQVLSAKQPQNSHIPQTRLMKERNKAHKDHTNSKVSDASSGERNGPTGISSGPGIKARLSNINQRHFQLEGKLQAAVSKLRDFESSKRSGSDEEQRLRQTNMIVVLTKKNKELSTDKRKLEALIDAISHHSDGDVKKMEKLQKELETIKDKQNRDKLKRDTDYIELKKAKIVADEKIRQLERHSESETRYNLSLKYQNLALRRKLEEHAVDYSDILCEFPTDEDEINSKTDPPLNAETQIVSPTSKTPSQHSSNNTTKEPTSVNTKVLASNELNSGGDLKMNTAMGVFSINGTVNANAHVVPAPQGIKNNNPDTSQHQESDTETPPSVDPLKAARLAFEYEAWVKQKPNQSKDEQEKYLQGPNANLLSPVIVKTDEIVAVNTQSHPTTDRTRAGQNTKAESHVRPTPLVERKDAK